MTDHVCTEFVPFMARGPLWATDEGPKSESVVLHVCTVCGNERPSDWKDSKWES